MRASRRIEPLLVVAALAVLVVLSWWLVGPLGVLALVALLLVPRVRRAVRVTGRRAVGALGVLAVVALAGVLAVTLLPRGTLPLPSGGGRWVTSSGSSEASDPAPFDLDVPQHPHLARNGTGTMHNDAWSSDAYTWAGPSGRDLEVRSAWYGVQECATLAIDSRGGLVGLCGTPAGPRLSLVDPDTLRIEDELELPGRPAGRDVPRWEDLCAGAYFFLDPDDRAVVATTDARILVVSTRDGSRRRLAKVDEVDVGSALEDGDCLLALMPDWSGALWFVTLDGVVGRVDPRSGSVDSVDLAEPIANSFSVDADGGVHVVTDTAAYRLDASPEGIAVTWRTPYDRGERRKPGQLTQGSGTTPTLLEDGIVVITDNAEPRMNVVALDSTDGSTICTVPVLDAGASATENSLVSLGDAVVVENNHGYGLVRSTLGRASAPGLARVDVARDGCRLAWTSDELAPSSVPKASAATGLLYAYTLRTSPWLVDAWYVTAIDVATGETAWSVRTGTGLLSNNHYAAITIAPDGALYVATLGGLVRVRDRPS